MKVYKTIETLPESGIIVIQEGGTTRLFFDFQVAEIPVQEGEEQPEGMYTCENIDFSGGTEYGTIVSAIHNGRYSNDEVQAILANYELAKDETSSITEEKRAEYIEDYQTWQAWRTHAKEIATIVIEQFIG